MPQSADNASVRLVLPIPPSANNLFVNRGGKLHGGRRRGIPYKLWLHEAQWAVKLQCGLFVPPLFDGIVAVDILAPLNRRRDLDNALKALLDLLVRQGVIRDDNLIDDLRIRRIGTGDKMILAIVALR